MKPDERGFEDNEDIFRKILDEPALQAVVMDHCLQRVFDRARDISGVPSGSRAGNRHRVGHQLCWRNRLGVSG